MPAAATGSDVQVRPGDTLSQIAVDHGVGDWTPLWQVNADRAEPGGHRLADPDYIEPGWTVSIPQDSIPAAGNPTAGDPAVSNPADPDADRADAAADTAAGSADIVVTVEAGDTLSEIAAAHGADIDAVTAANRGTAQPDGGALSDPDGIRPGWRLVIPAPAAAATDTTGTPPGSTGTPADNGGPDPADSGGGPAADTGTAVAAAPARPGTGAGTGTGSGRCGTHHDRAGDTVAGADRADDHCARPPKPPRTRRRHHRRRRCRRRRRCSWAAVGCWPRSCWRRCCGTGGGSSGIGCPGTGWRRHRRSWSAWNGRC